MTMTDTHSSFTAVTMPISRKKAAGTSRRSSMAAKAARIAAVTMAAVFLAASMIIAATMIYAVSIGIPLIGA